MKIKSKLALLLAGVMSFTSMFFSVDSVFADTLKNDLTNLKPIESLIKDTLDSKFEIMSDWKSRTGEKYFSNSSLLELYNNESKFLSSWYEKTNLKIDDYKTDVDIVNVKRNSLDTYLVDVLYDVEFHIVGDKKDETSQSVDEPHEFEIKNENGQFYINKMVDYIDDIGNFDGNQKKLFNEMDNYLANYDENLNIKKQEVKTKLEDIDELYEKLLNDGSDDKNKSSNHNIVPFYSGYNVTAAVKYAHKYWNSYNPAFTSYSNDCQNFASQVAYAGGVPGSAYWYSGSKSWIRVLNFYEYMNSNGFTHSGAERKGDIVQFYKPSDGTYTHSGILTAGSKGNWKFTAHTTNRKDYPLKDAMGTTYSDTRYVKFWH